MIRTYMVNTKLAAPNNMKPLTEGQLAELCLKFAGDDGQTAIGTAQAMAFSGRVLETAPGEVILIPGLKSYHLVRIDEEHQPTLSFAQWCSAYQAAMAARPDYRPGRINWVAAAQQYHGGCASSPEIAAASGCNDLYIEDPRF